MTLTEFLLAYFDKEEAWARSVLDADVRKTDVDPRALTLIEVMATKILAECKVKRRIVEAANDQLGGPNWRDAIDYAMREMATIYADNADYREEWRP